MSGLFDSAQLILLVKMRLKLVLRNEVGVGQESGQLGALYQGTTSSRAINDDSY